MIGTLIGLILPLGLDSFALSAAIAIAGVKGGARYRISALMACFEGGMPLVGLLLGRPLGNAFGSTAEYVAIGVLVAFGVWMLVHDEDEDEQMRKLASLRGWGMIVLGLSISMDELAIGFTIGLLKVPVIPALVAIFVQAFVLSQIGFRVGARVGERFTEGAEKTRGRCSRRRWFNPGDRQDQGLIQTGLFSGRRNSRTLHQATLIIQRREPVWIER